jgi:hypothetical protein
MKLAMTRTQCWGGKCNITEFQKQKAFDDYQRLINFLGTNDTVERGRKIYNENLISSYEKSDNYSLIFNYDLFKSLIV